MRPTLLLILFITSLGNLAAQVPIEQQRANAISVGKQLFLRQFAAWQALDHFQEQLNASEVEDLLVIAEQDSLCAFFFRHTEEGPIVEFAYWMDAEASVGSGREEVLPRPASHNENRLIRINDSLARFWERMFADNMHPKGGGRFERVILPGEQFHQAYIMTLSRNANQLTFGGDFHFIINSKGQVSHWMPLHSSTSEIDRIAGAETTAHLHHQGDPAILTPTDVCILMLYGAMTDWKKHLAVGPEQVSTWDLEKHAMSTQTRKSWDKQQK